MVHSLLQAFALYYLALVCQATVPADAPVLTRISEPVEHAEGPHWDPVDKVLYYVDIAGKTLHRYDPDKKTEHTISFDSPVALVVPIKDQSKKFVVALGLDLVVLTWDWEHGFSSSYPLVSVDQQNPTNRFNDGKADARGRMWAGTMGQEEPVGVTAVNKGSLYKVDNNPSVDCHAESMVSPVNISNGLAWTPDNKVMYYIDTPTRRVDAFDYDLDTGTISNRRTAFDFGSTPGNPDGMTIDSSGNLWVASWNGSMVIQVDPHTHKLLRQIKLPAERVTSVVFGGEKLDKLYVTTMRAGLTPTQLDAQPLAGAVWEITNLRVTGTTSHPAIVNCKCKH